MKELRDGKIKSAIFDMDGTIYQLDGDDGGFKNSSLHQNVKKNTLNFFAQRENSSLEAAHKIIDEINTKNIFASIYAAEKYNISRKEFFDLVWNIDPHSIVSNYQDAVEVISELSKRNIELILLTQAPQIWQNNVFKFLNLHHLFTEIHTGESYIHKLEMFPQFALNRDPQTVLAIGDQLETDILPAQNAGFYTFLVKSPHDLLKLIQDE